MAAKIQEELGLTAELIAGEGGIFDVLLDNWPVFSKFTTGQFPEEGKIIADLRVKLS